MSDATEEQPLDQTTTAVAPLPEHACDPLVYPNPIRVPDSLGFVCRLAEICSLAGYVGYGPMLVIGYHTRSFRDLVIERLRLLHPDGTLVPVDGDREVGLPDHLDEVCRCLLVTDVPWSQASLAQLRDLAIRHPATNNQEPGRRGVLWLCEIGAVPRGRATQEVLVASEPQDQPAIAGLIQNVESRFTHSRVHRLDEHDLFRAQAHRALSGMIPANVVLPTLRDRLSGELPPQSPARVGQVFELAAAMAVLRAGGKSATVVGTVADLDEAVALLDACIVCDDWPTVPAHLIHLAELIAQIEWHSDGMTYEGIQLALIREHPEKSTDPRYWPPTATPSDQWTYSSVRRRMQSFSRLGWMIGRKVAGEIRWFKTADLKRAVASSPKYWRAFSRNRENQP